MLKFNTYSPEFDRKICGRRGQVVTQALWCSIVVSCRENSVYSKTAQSEKTGVLRALESTGERRVFLRHNWLSRIPAWNAHEDERYKMLRRWLPRQMEKARSEHLRRTYNYTPVSISPLRLSTGYASANVNF